MTDQLAADELDDEASVASTDPDAPVSTDVEPPNPAPTEAAAVTSQSRRFGRGPKRQRISKWDRPPDPHDWRFFVGNLGKVLIATGLLLFGFVAYQLWGTGIETARAQNRLENQFEQILADSGAVVDTSITDDEVESRSQADDTDTADSGDVAPPPPDAETDADADDLDIVVGAITEGVPVAIDLSDEAVVQAPIPQPFRGDPLARLEIPAIGRDDIVVPGVSLDDLKDGPGHYPDTPLPGQLGNASIAGHRTTYGAPFINVDRLVAGDEIVATLLNGDRFVYEVTFVEVVTASDYWVVTTQNPDIAELTLTSCHPKYTARDRIVVHSVLNPDKSSNVGFPTFYSLETAENDDPIEGDDPVLNAGDIEITEPDPAIGEAADPTTGEARTGTVSDVDPTNGDSASGTASGGSDDQPRPVTEDELAEAQLATADPDPIDAFSEGWFDDREAFPQIALWGIVLTIISLLAYQVSKKFRHDSIGFLVGIFPFLFALYFFFQNINRLLPPGI